jgi:hypothetical protein
MSHLARRFRIPDQEAEMRLTRSIAVATLVTALLATAVPIHAASRDIATDTAGTSVALPTVGKTPRKFAGFHPSPKVWAWIAAGGVVFYVFARELGGSSH